MTLNCCVSSERLAWWEYQYIVHGCRLFLFVIGFYHIRVEGERDHAISTIICNHSSWLDILLVFVSFGGVPRFVAKKGVVRFPMVSFVSRKCGCILIDPAVPHDTASKIVAFQSDDNSREPKIDGDYLVIFPEGTTSNWRGLLNFHEGAFITRVPLQPMTIHYDYVYTSPTWDSIPVAVHIFDMLTQLYQSVTICFLPVEHPLETCNNPQDYAAQCRLAMATSLNIPQVDVNSTDKNIVHEAIQGKEYFYYFDFV